MLLKVEIRDEKDGYAALVTGGGFSGAAANETDVKSAMTSGLLDYIQSIRTHLRNQEQKCSDLIMRAQELLAEEKK